MGGLNWEHYQVLRKQTGRQESGHFLTVNNFGSNNVYSRRSTSFPGASGHSFLRNRPFKDCLISSLRTVWYKWSSFWVNLGSFSSHLDGNDFIWGSLSDDLFKTWPHSKSLPRLIEGHFLNFCWNPFQFSKLSFDSSEIGIFFDKIEATAFCPASLIKRQNARISIPTETLSTIQNAVFLMNTYDFDQK